jgi:hypothetical protein
MPRPKRIPNKGTVRTWAEIADTLNEDNYILAEYLGIPDNEVVEYEARTVQTIGRRALAKLRTELAKHGIDEHTVAQILHDRDAHSPLAPPASDAITDVVANPEDDDLGKISLKKVRR